MYFSGNVIEPIGPLWAVIVVNEFGTLGSLCYFHENFKHDRTSAYPLPFALFHPIGAACGDCQLTDGYAEPETFRQMGQQVQLVSSHLYTYAIGSGIDFILHEPEPESIGAV